MTDHDDQTLRRLSALDPALTDSAPSKGSTRYDSILEAAMKADAGSASPTRESGKDSEGGGSRRHHRRLTRRPALLAAALAVAAALCAVALFAGDSLTNFAGSAPLTPGEQAGRLIPELATGSTSASQISSNPYDYAADNPKMDALVALGTPALAELHKSIAAAPADGLNTYLMAIAAEKIAKVDLRAGSAADPWGTGKAWMADWHAHLKAIPADVATIAKSDLSQDEKTARLVALGTPALPLILDRVAAGDGALAPAATQLAQGTVEVRGIDVPAVVTQAWARDNVARFTELRQLVTAQQ